VLKAAPVLALPVFIMGGIYSGVFTPTESAAVSTLYAAVLALTVYRKAGAPGLMRISAESATVASSILLIMTATSILSYIITLNQIPLHFKNYVTELGLSKYELLLAINILLLFLGCFLEIISVILITVPILLPILRELDINLIHFAIIITVNMELAVITPPIGMNLYAISAISKTPTAEVLRGTLPFMLIMLAALMLFTYVPSLSLFTLEIARALK
jgi:C4-dicarboxylate transporter DctM subunit